MRPEAVKKGREVARIRIGSESHASFLKRYAVLLSDPLRLRIVTELYLRPMSPTLFFERFGGGSVSRVSSHFKVLVEHGWLRLLREKRGGKRFGGVEHFYRAPELAFFEGAAWTDLPYSIRAAFSSFFFEQFSGRTLEAMSAGTFDSRLERHFSWTPVFLDEIGWERVISAMNALFKAFLEEQEDAKLRAHDSGVGLFSATIALMGFESPGPAQLDAWAKSGRATSRSSNACGVSSARRIAKVFRDPICLKIVAELNLRRMSATGFYREFGGASRSGIHRRFKMLVETGWLTSAGEESGGKRRGGVERYFRATGPVVFDSHDWSCVPHSVRKTFSWTIFEQLWEQVEVALRAGTVDVRKDRHLSWVPLLLDQKGWENSIAALEALFAFILEEQAAAEKRVADSGGELRRITVALAGFESPKNPVKAP
jgi:DNA-binding transcriptional ArsR family regulator